MNKKKFFSGVKIILSVSILIFLFIQLNREVQQSEELQEKKAKEEIRLNVALVNEDVGTKVGDKEIQLAANYIKKIEKDHDHDYYIVSRGIAENGLKNDKYQLMITIPSNFSGKLLEINDGNPEKLTINYKINSNGNAEIENESNKVGTKIINDLDKQLVDMYAASILDNLYSAQLNIGKVAKNQEEYVGKYKNNVFQPATDFQTYLPALVSRSSSTSDYNDALTKSLESYTDSFASYMDSQKSYDTQLEELLAKRAEDKLTYEEFLVALSEMDTTLLSEETEAMYQELKLLDTFYQTNLGDNLTQDAYLKQVADLKKDFMGTSGEEVEPPIEEWSLVKQIDKGKKRLDIDEATLRDRFSKVMMTYFFGENGEEERVKELKLKHLFSGEGSSELKSDAANQEITEIIKSYGEFKKAQYDKDLIKRETALTNLETAFASLPFDQTQSGFDSFLTQDEQDHLEQSFRDIGQKINEIEEVLGADLGNGDMYHFPKKYDEGYQELLGRSFSRYEDLTSSSSSLLGKEYEVTFKIPGFGGVTGGISYPDNVRLTGFDVSEPYVIESSKENLDRGFFQFVWPNDDIPKPSTIEINVRYQFTDLPAIINANTDTADEISLVFKGGQSSIDPGFGFEQLFSTRGPVDYAWLHSDQYLSALTSFSAEKAKLLELTSNVANLFNEFSVEKINDTAGDELFTEDLFDNSVYSMMEDLIYFTFKDEFSEQLEVFQHLEVKAGMIAQQFGPLDTRLNELTENTLALQKNVSQQLGYIGQVRSLLTDVQTNESKVGATNEATDMTIDSNRETMKGLLETSEGIKENSENNVKESQSVKEVFTEFNTEVESAEQTSKELAENANSVLDGFEEELANNNNFYGTFATVMNHARKDGVPNETFLKFLANPINASHDSTVKSAEVYKPFTWVLMLFSVSLFAAYALATQDLGRRVKDLFDRDRLWITDNILNTVFVTGAGIVLGVMFSILSESALEITQEERLLWGIVIASIMLIFILLNHFLIKQLKIVGLGISVFLLTSYVFLTSAIGKTSVLNEFGAFVKEINPLAQSETILMSFFSQQSISGFTMMLMTLVVVIGIILNLIIWRPKKLDKEAEKNG